MMTKHYDTYIELTPGYESVVDINSDDRDADFWKRYIVNEDMVDAIKMLSKSLEPDDIKNDRRHFMIEGPYGTGKTYSAIVIKHLLQDDYDKVEYFLNNNPLFAQVKSNFLGIRNRHGKYFVKFRSGECKQLNTSHKFLLQLEQSVREILKENNFEYTGAESLTDAVRDKVKSFKSTLKEKYDDDSEEYQKYWKQYADFDEFYNLVMKRDSEVCANAYNILEDLGVSLATDLNTFKEWLKDVFGGNEELNKSGIFIIWDEFTQYMQNNNDIDIIQQLSMFSKELPFYIIYVIHEHPALFSESMNQSLGKADARFHKIDISLSDKTTFKLIGESIKIKDGMDNEWSRISDELYKSITDIDEYFGEPDSKMDRNTLQKIFPIHPKIIELVSKVAGIAATNRSIFKFLKSSDEKGFIEYIKNNGIYDGWKFVTPDYLWDYFFVCNQGGKKEITDEVKNALSHYDKFKDEISHNDRLLRVFKATMLLQAIVVTRSSYKNANSSKGLKATEKTICSCFSGIMSEDEVKEHLKTLSTTLNILVMSPDNHGDVRIEIPITLDKGEEEVEIENLKNQLKPQYIFDCNKYSDENYFGNVLKKDFIPNIEKAVIKRLTAVQTCLGGITPQIINQKFEDIKNSFNKSKSYSNFGLLIVAVKSLKSSEDLPPEELKSVENTIKDLIKNDETNRIIVAVIKHPISEDKLNDWYQSVARSKIAQKSGKISNAGEYDKKANELVKEWVTNAIEGEIDLIYSSKVSTVNNNKQVIEKYERIVCDMFKAAPENFINKSTLYKTPQENVVYFGVSKTTKETKSKANDKQKSFNEQWQSCVDILSNKDENVWEAKTIDDIISMNKTPAGRSMSSLFEFIKKELSSDTVFLNDMWDKMQKELGYYNTNICGYLLGFVFRFYIGKFTWNDGSNVHELNEDTIPKMIISMLKSKAVGMKLTSESESEKRFKNITKKIFSLKDNEIGNVNDCQKYVRAHITENGYPFWSLKYLDDSEYRGIKDDICKIIDKYTEFIILENRDPKYIIEEILELIKGHIKYEPLLTKLFSDKSNCEYGMRAYVIKVKPRIYDLCKKYKFTDKTLFNMLRNNLEEEKWQWDEDKVKDRIDILTLDLSLVGLLNSLLNTHAESVENVVKKLNEKLNYIRVPGCIYMEKYLPDCSWVKTVNTLYDISSNKWVSYDNDKKDEIIKELDRYGKDAFENITSPLKVLKGYIREERMGTFSEKEYKDILKELGPSSFLQPEKTFKGSIKNKIDKLDYTKKSNSILEIWRNKTDTVNVKSWEEEHIMPIIWVMPDKKYTDIFYVINKIKSELLDKLRIENTLQSIENCDFSILSNDQEIDRCFITNVSSEEYLGLLLDHITDLKEYFKNNGYDYSLWNSKINEIRTITKQFILTELKDDVCNKAKAKAEKMNDEELRAEVIKMCDSSPESCLFLLYKK